MRRVLLLLGAVGLLAGGCAVLGGDDGPAPTHVTIHFQRAVALYPHSHVKVLGLDAGTITAVEPEGDSVRVEIDVDGDVPIPADARAAVVPQSLIGERSVVLYPAWQPGEERMADGAEIPIERTDIPAEPDEALQAFTDLAQDLDPDEVARLVTEGAEALDGRGRQFNDALAEAGDLTALISREDDSMVAVARNLDRLASTLNTRDQQLGHVLDSFATATGVLADERQAILDLAAGLGDLAEQGNRLVAAHEDHLPEDLAQLTNVTRAARVNLDAIAEFFRALAANSRGLIGAYDPTLGVLRQRINLTPITAEVLRPFFEALGVEMEPPCVPSPGTQCP